MANHAKITHITQKTRKIVHYLCVFIDNEPCFKMNNNN